MSYIWHKSNKRKKEKKNDVLASNSLSRQNFKLSSNYQSHRWQKLHRHSICRDHCKSLFLFLSILWTNTPNMH